MALLPGQASAATAKLAWNANSPAPDSYRVFRRTAGQTYNYAAPVWSGAIATCTLSNLADNTTYYFVVRAQKGSATSSDSNEVTYRNTAVSMSIYTITASAAANGTITPSGKATVSPGASKTYQIAAKTGYRISTVMVDGVSKGAISSYTFSAIKANHTISASFVSKTYALTASAGTNGTITPSGKATVSPGASKTYQIAAKTGYRISKVMVDGVSKGVISSYTFSAIKANHTISASFVSKTIALKASSGTNGTIVEEYQSDHDMTTAPGNSAPDRPEVTNPKDGDIDICVIPKLFSSAFCDPDLDDTHTKTQWRITDTYAQCIVLKITSDDRSLTNLGVPPLVLDPDTRYTCEVRYYDNHGSSSEWSSPVSFTTLIDKNDMDYNGVPDDQQVVGQMDLNADGIDDAQQESVMKSVQIATTAAVFAVSIENSSTAASVEGAFATDPNALDPPIDDVVAYDYGVLGYKILVQQPGQTTDLTLYFSDPLAPRSRWKRLDAEAQIVDCTEQMTIADDGGTAVLSVTDGGQGDADGMANGIVVDMLIPIATVDHEMDDKSAYNNASSGGGGCFIESLMLAR